MIPFYTVINEENLNIGVYTMKGSKELLLYILAVGVFGILNTEMGVIGYTSTFSPIF